MGLVNSFVPSYVTKPYDITSYTTCKKKEEGDLVGVPLLVVTLETSIRHSTSPSAPVSDVFPTSYAESKPEGTLATNLISTEDV